VNVLDLIKASAKDFGSGQRIARRYLERLTLSSAAVNLSINSSTLGADTVRFIHTVSFNAGPGAGQSFLFAQANLQDPSTFVLSAIQFMANVTPVAAQIIIGSVTSLELVQMQGEVINVQAQFSAGGVANSFTADLIGWEFPRGNLQR
jgi:hypothetical protein